jgi:hypothetical protein
MHASWRSKKYLTGLFCQLQQQQVDRRIHSRLPSSLSRPRFAPVGFRLTSNAEMKDFGVAGLVVCPGQSGDAVLRTNASSLCRIAIELGVTDYCEWRE